MRRVGICLLMALLFAPAVVRAANLAPARPHAGSNMIEAAAQCGPNSGYIRGHQDKRGRYVRGHCAPIKRR
jgi:hypothetical protein